MLARMERKAKRKKKKMARDKRDKKKSNYSNPFQFIHKSHIENTAVIEDSSPIGLFEGDPGAESNIYNSNL